MAEPKRNETDTGSADRQVEITRIFDAPRELVFQAWTDPEQLVRWYAPQGCSIVFRKLELRAGGSFHSCIRTPDGYECWCRGVYREFVPPERLVFNMVITDAEENDVDPVAKGMDPEWPKETLVTLTFEAIGNKTRFTLHQTASESIAKRTGAYPSWLQMLDHLEVCLKSMAAVQEQDT